MSPAPTNWQQALADGFQDLAQLCEYLQLDPSSECYPDALKNRFPLRVPRSFAACMEKGNPHDPLLRQVLPDPAELRDFPGYTTDPVGDLQAHAAPGVIHKYHGRALLISTGACAVHCRYCFRRNFPYADVQLSKSQLSNTLDYVRAHPDIQEIILSGGDPLLLNDARLSELLTALQGISHVQRIRIHSRIPVVLPERITPELIALLRAPRQRIVMVLHANHAKELSADVAQACQALGDAGITLLNQTVLLKQVNDSPSVLRELSERLFELRVMPYYLHVLDKASGTGHFEVSKADAVAIYHQLQSQLPGYLVPKLVTEQAGAAYKLPVS